MDDAHIDPFGIAFRVLVFHLAPSAHQLFIGRFNVIQSVNNN